MVPSQLPVQWVNRSGRDVDHSPPYNAEFNVEWNYTSTSPICLHGVKKNKFTILFIMWRWNYQELQNHCSFLQALLHTLADLIFKGLRSFVTWSSKAKEKQSHYRPWGFQEVEASRFQDSRHMKVVRLSALRTGHLYPTGNISGTHFC